MRWSVVAVAALGCGRVGFDPASDASGLGGDGAPLGIAFMQAQFDVAVAVTSMKLTFSTDVRAGDTLIVAFDLSNPYTAAPTAISDTLGSTFTIVGPFDRP